MSEQALDVAGAYLAGAAILAAIWLGERLLDRRRARHARRRAWAGVMAIYHEGAALERLARFRTWRAGEVVTAATMNQDVRDVATWMPVSVEAARDVVIPGIGYHAEGVRRRRGRRLTTMLLLSAILLVACADAADTQERSVPNPRIRSVSKHGEWRGISRYFWHGFVDDRECIVYGYGGKAGGLSCDWAAK